MKDLIELFKMLLEECIVTASVTEMTVGLTDEETIVTNQIVEIYDELCKDELNVNEVNKKIQRANDIMLAFGAMKNLN